MTVISQMHRDERSDFKNTIIIMTSNAGASKILSQPKRLGFGVGRDAKKQIINMMKDRVMEEVTPDF